MSKHQEWKMLHLLYGHARLSGDRSVLSLDELEHAGVHCLDDTIMLLEQNGIVSHDGDEFSLTNPTRAMISRFTVALGPEANKDIRVDYPEAFVVMAFGEPWSDRVYDDMLVPGIEAADFIATRGDEIVRVGDLSTNVWQSITQAGVIVADVSVPNPNVYHEIGLADALGKPVFLFKQSHVTLPADFSGIHYYEYDMSDVEQGRDLIRDELLKWADHEDHQPFGVRDLVDGSR
ncbi:MAG: hypothetical protein QNJ12_13015 [Ilumatobacter sp.]|uniref:hypothetical protein n=1 Tax=Ilumatobacter sp. TaxID=1967498 RepID=UPI00262E8A16|nr:hypothetical protein [Ilumatobacter sp.]MDJ0769716.1 hypothetical protein [Ilumatobacter sp.]